MESSLPTQVGPYRLLHRLGTGGMASVYAVEHETEGHRMALKLLSPTAALDPALVVRFREEAEILTRLQLPGVVRGMGSGRHEQMVYLLMEWLHGQTLRAWMDRRAGPVPLADVLVLGARLADILAQVHAQGIVHRDLKPENIFLCSPEDGPLGPRLRLLDFGIAKQPPRVVDSLDPTQVHTQESALMGSYPYMAPEQFRSATRVDPSVDVYALGILLFELLAGRRPFVSEEPSEILSAHVSQEPPSLREFVSSLPAGVCVFIDSMLAKEPGQRPSMRRCHDVLGGAWADAPEARLVPGLAPFTQAEAELFFGRDEELQALLALLGELHTGARRWLQVEGPSGVGKSSLIHAGLLPRLARTPGWRVVCVRPRDEPLRALARALASGPLRLGAEETVEHSLRSGAGALRDFAAAHTPEGGRLLLVLEPLEELFTLGAAECPALDALLSAALDDPGSPLRLLTGVRADFLHRLEQVPALAGHLRRAARFPLWPMQPAALIQVVDGMARQTGLRLEKGLAHRMVQDARDEAGGLALLGHALHALCTLSGGARLTHAQYERLGGVGGALVQRAEALLDSLGPQGRERARWMILCLVQPGRGVPDTRRPRSRREVLAAGGDDRLAEQVLLRLSGLATGAADDSAGLRLLQLSEGSQGGEQRVDLVHELLLQRVRSIAGWIEQERTGLERRAALEGLAHEWHEAECPVEGLPTGSLLEHYREGGPAPGDGAGSRRESPEVVSFLQAAQRLERRRALTRRGTAVAAAVAVLTILFYSARAEDERERAEGERQQAEASLKQFIARMDEFAGDSDWELSWLPYTAGVREQMLKGFRQSLDALTFQQRQSPEVRHVAIKLIHRQADFAFQEGKLKEAGQYLDEAGDELLAALAAQPRDGALLKLRALQASKRGKVEQARGELFRACESFTRAVRALESPEGVSDDEVDDRRTLAVSRSELAECEIALRRWDEASAQLDEAIRLHQENGASYNEALLAQVYLQRGQVARVTHRTEAARADLDQALRLGWSSVLEAEAGDQYSQWVLARVLVDVAAFQSTLPGPREEAARKALAARELGERLLEGAPSAKRYALVWLEALARQAELTQGPESTGLRARRCRGAQDIHGEDREDVRFMFEDCPDVRPRAEKR